MGAEEARLFAREGAKVVIADVLEDESTRLAAEFAYALRGYLPPFGR